ncbi:MAG: type I-F CRISPR-associated protein Csy3 [Gammaproteobacteria bacterium]|nr:type I-F CRISPR-associated protein Csy3 [Gammaproteobacteria bacterium]MDH5730996.1 type I-F CRISPR-associated protein Csy3 [Gammaproteobacteria bacterium]
MSKITIPSLLNYTRSIIPSEGVFSAIMSDGASQPIVVQEKTVLGTIANYGNVYKKGDKQANEDEINKQMMGGKNNIQRIDACYLPPEADTLELAFTIKVLGNSQGPDACNNTDVRDKLESISSAYSDKNGYEFLARQYVGNIINGSFLWRNRYGWNKTVTLWFSDKPKEQYLFGIIDQRQPVLKVENQIDLDIVCKTFAKGLSGELPVVIHVKAQVTIGQGQEVYPSQEFVESRSSQKSKVLFTIEQGGKSVAGMHSQKIGNALRTIDQWYPGSDGSRPLAVDPFTVDKRRGETVRLPDRERSDFYSLLKNIDELNASMSATDSAEKLSGDVHYFMANLIRGGVFSGESQSK